MGPSWWGGRRVGRPGGGRGTAGPFPAVRWQRRAEVTAYRAARAAKMFFAP
jgi:hypothetical protein